MIRTCLWAATLIVVGQFAAATATQDSPPAKQDAPAAVERLAQWPKLDTKAAAALKQDVERLRKANTREMEEQGEAALLAAGAAAAPELLAALGKEKDLQARLRIETLLERITGAPHTRLLAPEFANKSAHVRMWCLRRCAAFPDEGIAKFAEEALARAQAEHAKKPELEGALEELYVAALCTTSAGGLGGFEQLVNAALEHWGKRGAELRAALEAVRGDKATDRVTPLLAGGDRKKVVAALNLLAGCGSRKALPLVSPSLDSTDNSIRVAAINAMRGIVDGAPPLDKLSAFDAIEMAKKWKDRAL